jgi:hypothetical protein
MKFICVFSEESKNELLEAGFILLREDEYNSIYIFHDDPSKSYALADISFIRSDSLSF